MEELMKLSWCKCKVCLLSRHWPGAIEESNEKRQFEKMDDVPT
jgi:hypothetical protein